MRWRLPMMGRALGPGGSLRVLFIFFEVVLRMKMEVIKSMNRSVRRRMKSMSLVLHGMEEWRNN